MNTCKMLMNTATSARPAVIFRHQNTGQQQRYNGCHKLGTAALCKAPDKVVKNNVLIFFHFVLS